MKKMIALLLACLMVFTMMACASTKDEPTDGEGVAAELPEAGGDMEQMPETGQPAGDTVEEEQPAVEEPPVDELPVEEPVVEPAEEPVVSEPDGTETPAGETADSSALQTILDTLLLDLDAEFIPYYSSYEVPQADAPYVVGYEQMDTNFEAALGYGPMMGSTAFIMVLFELPEDVDAEAYAKSLSENAVLNKWICVSADYADGLANGQYVMFLMAAETACPDTVRQELADRFMAIDTAALNA